jgi:hypothetical protein
MRRRGPHLQVIVCDARDAICVRVRGCDTTCATPATDLELWVKRRGRREWLVKYPAWDVSDDGMVCFRIDDLFPTEHGRYDGVIYDVAGAEIGYVELFVPRKRQVVAASRRRGHSRRKLSKPQGATDMYDAIEGFSAKLCGTLEKTDTVLPLSSTDAAFLCGLTLCKPAQLVIDDGINQEIIEWRCTGGQVEITRAVTGVGPFKFPRGADVYFDWTEANVVNAMTGC